MRKVKHKKIWIIIAIAIIIWVSLMVIDSRNAINTDGMEKADLIICFAEAGSSEWEYLYGFGYSISYLDGGGSYYMIDLNILYVFDIPIKEFN